MRSPWTAVSQLKQIRAEILLIYPVFTITLRVDKCSHGYFTMNSGHDDDQEIGLDPPSPLELARHECALLHGELREVWADPRLSKRNVARLVQMKTMLANDLAKLRQAQEPTLMGLTLRAQ